MTQHLTVSGYLVLSFLGLGIAVFSWLFPKKVAPFSLLMDYLSSALRTRLALVAIWWWLGWHFFSNVPLGSVVP
jgi:hypothetical protein